MTKTIFEKIIDGEIPSTVIYENEGVIVINDISPQAPIHCLVITKHRYANIEDIDVSDFSYVQDAIKHTTKTLNISESGYRVVTNIGSDGGQSVPHLHFHILGGKRLSTKIG